MRIHSKFPSAYEFKNPAIQKAGFSYVLCKDDKNHNQYGKGNTYKLKYSKILFRFSICFGVISSTFSVGVLRLECEDFPPPIFLEYESPVPGRDTVALFPLGPALTRAPFTPALIPTPFYLHSTSLRHQDL